MGPNFFSSVGSGLNGMADRLLQVDHIARAAEARRAMEERQNRLDEQQRNMLGITKDNPGGYAALDRKAAEDDKQRRNAIEDKRLGWEETKYNQSQLDRYAAQDEKEAAIRAAEEYSAKYSDFLATNPDDDQMLLFLFQNGKISPKDYAKALNDKTQTANTKEHNKVMGAAATTNANANMLRSQKYQPSSNGSSKKEDPLDKLTYEQLKADRDKKAARQAEITAEFNSSTTKQKRETGGQTSNRRILENEYNKLSGEINDIDKAMRGKTPAQPAATANQPLPIPQGFQPISF